VSTEAKREGKTQETFVIGRGCFGLYCTCTCTINWQPKVSVVVQQVVQQIEIIIMEFGPNVFMRVSYIGQLTYYKTA